MIDFANADQQKENFFILIEIFFHIVHIWNQFTQTMLNKNLNFLQN